MGWIRKFFQSNPNLSSLELLMVILEVRRKEEAQQHGQKRVGK